VLDEPAAVQSDPTLLNLQLRQLSKDTPGVRMEVVGCIEHGDKDRRQRLATWISSIADLHKNKPAAAVHYSRPMPDLEVLMQEWPPELEAALRSSKLPTADLVRKLVLMLQQYACIRVLQRVSVIYDQLLHTAARSDSSNQCLTVCYVSCRT
jgi:intraflagellar transport protein 46